MRIAILCDRYAAKRGQPRNIDDAPCQRALAGAGKHIRAARQYPRRLGEQRQRLIQLLRAGIHGAAHSLLRPAERLFVYK